MGAEIEVDGSIFTFDSGCVAEPFDTWTSFRKLSGDGVRGCDIVATSGSVLWLIEAKDYTYAGAAPPENLVSEIVEKAVSTMGVLFALPYFTQDTPGKTFAKSLSAISDIHLCLHLNEKVSIASNQAKSFAVTKKQQLRQAGNRIGASRTFITSNNVTSPDVPWTATRDPATRLLHQGP